MAKESSSTTTTPQGFNSEKQPTCLPELQSGGVHQPVILVADDEVLIRNVVTIMMQQEGYFVLSASDGQEGLELSRQYPGKLDLAITDLQMPRLNGADLCAHLLEERPGIRLLVMSGADISEIVSQNANMPFLPKPFDGETLKARVREILAVPVQPPTKLTLSDQSGVKQWINDSASPNSSIVQRDNDRRYPAPCENSQESKQSLIPPRE